jgi:hypothetical protein
VQVHLISPFVISIISQINAFGQFDSATDDRDIHELSISAPLDPVHQ